MNLIESLPTVIGTAAIAPALLETDQGNKFSARVFPVPPSGTVRLLLAFSQPLPLKDGQRKLTIPLAGMPKIGEFTFSATGRPLD